MLAEDLPGILADIAEIAGVDAALEYAARFGGPAVYIPREYDPDHQEHAALASVVGEDQARAIVDRIGGGMVRIPNARRERIMRAVEVMAEEPIKRVCRMLGVSERTVYREKARRRLMETQGRLF